MTQQDLEAFLRWINTSNDGEAYTLFATAGGVEREVQCPETKFGGLFCDDGTKTLLIPTEAIQNLRVEWG